MNNEPQKCGNPVIIVFYKRKFITLEICQAKMLTAFFDRLLECDFSLLQNHLKVFDFKATKRDAVGI